MTRIPPLPRSLALVAVLVASAAFAQPVNDLCANAIALPTIPGDGTLVTGQPVGRLDLADGGVETTTSCGSSPQRSVWYSFVAPVTGNYVISNCAFTNFDSILQVYLSSSGNCSTLAQVSSGCSDDACGSASQLNNFALTGGNTYYVQVAAYSSSIAIDATSRTGLQVGLAVAPRNDRCDGTVPALSVNTPWAFLTNAATGNDSQVGGEVDGGANSCFVGVGHSTSQTANVAPGRDVVFSFTPPSSSRYNIRLQNTATTVNTVLYLTDSCVTAMTPPQNYTPPQCIAATNRATSSTTAAEDLICVPLNAAQPYFIWADETASSTGGANYELEVTSCTPEVEPNDTIATAAPTACPVTANIRDAGTTSPGSDVDFYSLGTPPAGSRVYAMTEATGSSTNLSSFTDYDLRVTTTTDTLEFDGTDTDGIFGSSAGNIAGTPLTGAPAYLRVNANASATTAREPYRLYSVVQSGTPTPEVEPNGTFAEASGGSSNWFSGDVTSATDVDLFAFTARAGQLVFISLDGYPSRSGTAVAGSHALALLDSNAMVLVSVNDTTTQTPTLTAAPGTLTGTTPTVPSEGLVYRIRQDGTYFARVTRSSTSTTVTGAYHLSVSTDCGTGGGIGAPSISGVTPLTGTISGGTTLTISGSNFASVARVTVGGALATVTARTASSLTITTPPGAEGAAAIVVTNPGNQSATFTGFTYFTPVAPPTITNVTPVTGPTAGGTVVTITGTLFKPNVEVTFSVGGVVVPSTAITIVNSNQMQVTTPPHAAGPATITVRNPADDLPTSAVDAFTYLAPPAITAITPNTGLTSGGLTITITGTAFRTGAVVRFGTVAGTNVVVDPSGTSLTVTSPAAATNGPVNVTVVNADTQQVVVTGGFTYAFPMPTISSITPNSGRVAGGTPITIDGTGFQAAPTVSIGGAPATSIVRVSLTRITAVTPAGTAGLADVVVTNSDAQAVTQAAGFRYVPPPQVTSLTPNHGPTQGGTLITVTGQDFLPGAVVRLGGVPAFAATVTSATTITAITNSAMAGVVDVQVENSDRDRQTATLMGAFTYDAAPSIATLSPVTGSTAGGTTITIVGTGFLAGATVLLGSSPATGVNVVSSTELTAVTPARPVGVVSVTVRNADGQLSELPRAYRFVAPPTVTAAAPNTGDVRGGTVVTLTGTGFAAGATVEIGGAAATNVTVVSGTQLEVTTPAHAPGAVDIVVTSSGASATLANGFTYTRGAPTLSAVAPLSGPIAGGTLLTLSGSGFAQGATVTVGGTPATGVVVVSDVLARAIAPAHAAGAVDVVITNDDSQAATLANAFTYVTPPAGEFGTITDGGSGTVGQDPVVEPPVPGGVSCGCSSFDASSFSLAGFGLLMVLSRRRRRS